MADLLSGGMQVVGSLFNVWGNMASGRAARIDGEQKRANAELVAQQEEQEAGLAIAQSQRLSAEELRKGRYEASRALAVAAASGGGVTDPTIVNLLSKVKGESVYRSSLALYAGESRARKLRIQAAATTLAGTYADVQGNQTEQNYDIAAWGSLFQGGSSMFAKYGGGGPNATSDAGSYVSPSNRM